MVQWLSLLEMDPATRVQILDDTVGISDCANTLGKDMHLAVLSSARFK